MDEASPDPPDGPWVDVDGVAATSTRVVRSERADPPEPIERRHASDGWTAFTWARVAVCLVAGVALWRPAFLPSSHAYPPVRPECEMVALPAATVALGSEREPDQAPVVRREIAGFALDVTEVTVAMYSACVSAGFCKVPPHAFECNQPYRGRENHPVTCVSQVDAARFCAWMGKRLPTETEWEYAARSEDARWFVWGDEEPPVRGLCWRRRAIAGSCEVGTSAVDVTDAGVRDLGANVREWTSTQYSPSYLRPDASTPRDVVLRGGAFSDRDARAMWASRRFHSPPEEWRRDVGFRCAR